MKIEVQNNGNETSVGTDLDPLLSAKVLLEGVGVLVPQIIKWSATEPKELKQSAWNMGLEEVLSRLHENLEEAARDYQTRKAVRSPIQDL